MQESKAKAALEGWNEYVAKTNAEFKDASPNEKRVILAKDVLAQLCAGMIRATPGVYVSPGLANGVLDDAVTMDQVAQCNACAIGSLAVAACRRDGRTYQSARVWWNSLTPYFSERSLRSMEDAFEVCDDTFRDGEDRVVGSAEDHLRLIMESVARNNGRFVRDAKLKAAVKKLQPAAVQY